MKYNVRLAIAYDGTRYLGWQKTKMGPSIEETLEKALTQILQEDIFLQAASRTDAGVHAKEQIVNFISEKAVMPLDRLQRALNGVLPNDISIAIIESAPLHFHPTLDCRGKEYRYSICNGRIQLPFHRQFSWHYYYPLAISEMQKAAACFVGTHDFSAFCNDKAPLQRDPICEIYHLDVIPIDLGRLTIRIHGNKFLYKMIRTIVGTLVYAGCGKLRSDSLEEILNSRDRKKAGMTAPAHGLCLHKVFYS
jgi:tRNA pseudouridine38-40 synthase